MVLFCYPASARTIIDEWNTVKAPPAPELKSVTVDPKVTALLMLDFNRQTCNADKRPRCIASIPKVQKLLTEARGAVLYTASEAAFRGMQVIVPVDGMSAESVYAEQSVAWNMVNAPRVSSQSALTKIDIIKY